MNVPLILFIAAVCGSSVFAASQGSGPSHPPGMEKTVATGVNTFAVELMKLIHKQSEPTDNVLFSPLCVYEALSLMHLGSAGTTSSELATVMGLPADDSKKREIHESLKSIIQNIQYKPQEAYAIFAEVSMASGLFVQKDFPVKPEFVSQARNYYESNVSNVDFANNAAGATETINQWVSKKTKGRIPKLYTNPLAPDTEMVLASSLYFNGRWKMRFPVQNTKPEKFNTGAGDVEVQMMNDQQYIRHLSCSKWLVDVIALPYLGDFSMVIVLPHPTQTLKNLTDHLKPTDLRGMMSKAESKGVDYKIPRMKFPWKKSLKEPLSTSGLSSFFQQPDLSNMVSVTKVKVSDVFHATEMEVDEDGTVATAITGVQIVRPSANPPPPVDPVKFYVNRPFMVHIYYKLKKVTLFSGLVYNPIQP